MKKPRNNAASGLSNRRAAATQRRGRREMSILSIGSSRPMSTPSFTPARKAVRDDDLDNPER